MRSLTFPKAPPEGLCEFAMRGEEDIHVIFYQAEWVPDNSFDAVLTDRVGRKERAVRCRCSACNQSFTFPYINGGCKDYGFLTPEYDGFASDGDTLPCPMCDAPCKVVKASTVPHGGAKEIGKYSTVSASLDKERNLVLTMWHVIKWVHRDDLREELVAHPVYAYQFGATDCEKYRALYPIYGGNFGYRDSYRRYWSTAKRWSEDWGAVDKIFGLTPELVAESRLPHCKLDVYMSACGGLVNHYPVAWLRLCQTHPNAEALLVHGLPLVLCELIAEDVQNVKWESNKRGLPQLPEIAWSDKRPAQMLSLNRDEFVFARDLCFGAYFWRLYIGMRRHGERIGRETFDLIARLGEDKLLPLVGEAPMRRIVAYLARQVERVIDSDTNCDDVDPPEDVALPDAAILLDYWQMQRKLGANLDNALVRFPRDLIAAHDRAAWDYRRMMDAKKEAKFTEGFAAQHEALKRFDFAADGLSIHAVKDYKELKEEGNKLHHCVASYAEKIAMGETAIFLLRKDEAPETPYFTVELDVSRLAIRQNRGNRNCAPPEAVVSFVDLWLTWARAGCREDKSGAPVLSNG